MRFYKQGKPYHAGVVEHDGAIYYIGSDGWAVKGEHIVHGVMCNDILKRGTYTFGEDYKLIKDSYRAPKKGKIKRRKSRSVQKPRRRVKYPAQAALGVALIVIVLLTVVYLIYTQLEPDHPIEDTGAVNQTGEQKDGIVLPQFEEEVLLCRDDAKQIFDHGADIADVVHMGDPYRPFVFEYRLEDVSGILRLSEDSAFTTCREYILEKDRTSVSIDNLKTGTQYYYRVSVDGKDYSGTFRTAQSNRFVSIPGVVNLRDIGGYKTLDGKTIKQGLLIRGVEMDGIKNSEYFVSDEDIPEVLDTFGFVYDLDLRSPDIYAGVYQSRLGADIGHKFYDAPMYAQIFRPEYLASLREIFADLADPDKYPMYLHCTWGMDRTGTVVLLLQGLLNVSKEDMLQEYRLTGYVTPAVATNSKMDALIWGLEAYEGDTLQEKIISYLTTTVGVTEEEIASIQSILLE